MRDIRGITLVALVITIIILLILAGVALSFFQLDKSFIKQTKEATESYNKSAQAESNSFNNITQTLEQTLGMEAKEIQGKILKQNTKYCDEEGNMVTVPKDFALSNKKEEQTISQGMVITDQVDEKGNSIGNEFVWVPVKSKINYANLPKTENRKIKFTNNSTKLVTNFLVNWFRIF